MINLIFDVLKIYCLIYILLNMDNKEVKIAKISAIVDMMSLYDICSIEFTS